MDLHQQLPVGSLLETAARFIPATERRWLQALFCLRQQVLVATLSPRETDIQRLRLSWWREELQRLAIGEPRHPATLPFSAAVADGRLQADWFDDWCVAADSQIRGETCTTLEEAKRSAFRRDGLLLCLLTRLTQPAADADSHLDNSWRYCVELGLAMGILDALAEEAGRPARLVALLPAQWQAADTAADTRRRLLGVATGALASAGELYPSNWASEARLPGILHSLYGALADKLRGRTLPLSSDLRLHPLSAIWRAWRQARMELKRPRGKPVEY